MSRFVIKHPQDGYFTEMKVERSEMILAPMDMVIHPGSPPVPKGSPIGTEIFCTPLFEAFKPSQATHFDTRADAENQIRNNDKNHGGPKAFDGCLVEETDT
jgi:hypothetical protein